MKKHAHFKQGHRPKLSHSSKLNKLQGVGLIEILVTIVITSIGLMGLVSMQMQALRATSDSGNRSQAIWLFNDITNRIHANEASSASYITVNGVTCQAPTPVCSSYHDGESLITPENCTGAQLAAWDNYEVACPLRGSGFIGDSSKNLPDAKLFITCVSGTCDNGDPLLITLRWRARADDETVTGATRDENSGLLTLTEIINP